MKTKRLFFSGLLMIAVIIYLLNSCKSREKNVDSISGTINISGAFALYPMTVLWAEEFMKLHPDVKINISAGGAGKGMADVLTGLVDIGMFSREVKPEEKIKGAYAVAVARDAVLPVINEKNPVKDKLLKNGLKRKDFIRIFIEGQALTWGEITGSDCNEKIIVFTRSDACGAAEMWGNYLGKDQGGLLGTGVYGDPGISEAVKNNVNAIGYNNVVYVYDQQNRKKNKGIEVVPIDLNDDGTIDSTESFYSNMDEIITAVKKGVYPSPPSRDLYFIFNGKPQNPLIIEFVKWVLTHGQKMLNQAGYVNLSEEKIRNELSKIE